MATCMLYDPNNDIVWKIQIAAKHLTAFQLLETYVREIDSQKSPDVLDTTYFHAICLFNALNKIIEGRNTIEIDLPCLRKILDLEDSEKLVFIAEETLIDSVITLPLADDLTRKRKCPCEKHDDAPKIRKVLVPTSLWKRPASLEGKPDTAEEDTD